MPQRPFRVLGVQQLALGASDRAGLVDLWRDCLGLETLGTFQSARENVDELMLALGTGAGRVEVDLMQPLDHGRKPDVSKPALNHVGLWVDDLRAAVCWLCGRGVRIARGGIRRGASGHDVCFIHPRASHHFPISGCGALLELVQAPGDVVAAHEPATRGR